MQYVVYIYVAYKHSRECCLKYSEGAMDATSENNKRYVTTNVSNDSAARLDERMAVSMVKEAEVQKTAMLLMPGCVD